MALSRRAAAEFFGTFWLVFGGCGSAVIAAAFPQLGIGFAGVALAFGLTLLTMAYTIGPISGCHINPAVTFGLYLAKRFPARDVLPYMIAQVLGAIAAAAVLYLIASGKPGFVAGQFASNGYGALSPGGYAMSSAIVAELVCTLRVRYRDIGRYGSARARWFCGPGDRARLNAHPSDHDSNRQHFGQSGAQHRAGDLCRRRGAFAALALLDRAADRRRPRRARLSGAIRRGSERRADRR